MDCSIDRSGHKMDNGIILLPKIFTIKMRISFDKQLSKRERERDQQKTCFCHHRRSTKKKPFTPNYKA